MIDIKNMDWNDPFKRRELAAQLLLSDPNVSEEEKAYIVSALEMIKVLEDFRPIRGKEEGPVWPPRGTWDILGVDSDKNDRNCNDNF